MEDRLQFFSQHQQRCGLRQRLLLAPEVLLQLLDPSTVLARLLRRRPSLLGLRQRSHRALSPLREVRGENPFLAAPGAALRLVHRRGRNHRRFLGKKKAKRVRLAVMDMWKAFRNSTHRHAPQAAILFDKFHVMRHLGEALDQIRKAEYARLDGKQRRFIKGQKYTLLSHPQNLTGTARKNSKLLLVVNKRLNTAYVLKESFGQLWDYNREAWARKFFENWRASLKWQRLKPYEKFADMIERLWDGIAAYCQPENNVALGFVEGLNNKIRVIQRRAYGLRDEEYLRLKVLSSMLPQI